MSVQLIHARCQVCTHPETVKLNVALITAVSTMRELEAAFPGVSKSALSRHKKTCLPSIAATALQALAGASDTDETFEPETVEGRTKEMISKLRRAITLAEKRKDTKVMFAGAREYRGFLDILGEITGELKAPSRPVANMPMFQLPPGTTVNVTINQNNAADSGSADRSGKVIELIPEEASI